MGKSEQLNLRECVIGDRAFYGRVLTIVLPIIVQNTLTNVVSLLDNVMVGQVGTLPMSGVAIVSQLLMVYYLSIWGSTAGAGIFGAQFFGRGDMDGVKHTFRFKLIISAAISLAALAIFGFFGRALIAHYIAADTSSADTELTLRHAMDYLEIMMIGLIPFGLTQCYAGTLRESGETVLPMKASLAAIAVNFVFNALLIFGLCGFPRLGVEGAAIATVLSRFVELAIILFSIHSRHDETYRKHRAQYAYFDGVYRAFLDIPAELVRSITAKSLPLLLNELLWSLGQAVLLQCYSVRGIEVVAAMNICSTVAQIFNTAFLSLGNATGIIVGQELGADRLRDARCTAWRMMVLSLASCVVMGLLLALCAPFIPMVYNVEHSIRTLAAELIRVCAVCMPLFGVAHCAFFTIRSGGKALMTFLFDSCFSWVVSVPAAYLLSHCSALGIVEVYLAVCALDVIKCIIGIALLKKGIWVKNIVK